VNHFKKKAMKKLFLFFTVIMLSLLLNVQIISAHCDTMDGPVVKDAKKAIETNNVNYVLKWVRVEDEKEIKEAFNLAMKVRPLSQEARLLADKYFFETLVRVHRAGEGMAFTGVKPSGTPIDEKIKAADQSIESGNLAALEKMVPEDQHPELQRRFDRVESLKNFDVNNVKAGREYIEAYVQFFHFAEGETEAHAEAHGEHAGH
jgi:hypothetical protein